jgi:hypothetical protein
MESQENEWERKSSRDDDDSQNFFAQAARLFSGPLRQLPPTLPNSRLAFSGLGPALVSKYLSEGRLQGVGRSGGNDANLNTLLSSRAPIFFGSSPVDNQTELKC